MSEWLVLRRISEVSPHYTATIIEAESSAKAVERLQHLPDHLFRHAFLVVPMSEVREYRAKAEYIRQVDVKVSVE